MSENEIIYYLVCACFVAWAAWRVSKVLDEIHEYELIKYRKPFSKAYKYPRGWW